MTEKHKKLFMKIQSIIDEHKKEFTDGEYLEACNHLCKNYNNNYNTQTNYHKCEIIIIIIVIIVDFIINIVNLIYQNL